ncbi:hypothetical protein K8I61_01810, partial [bacterium]|nr:hypothetical protein [bacterium]
PRGDRPPRDRDRDRDGAPRETGRGDDLAMFGRRPERAAKGSQRDARQLGEKSSTTFKPFAGLKIVDGKIVMEPDESESGKGKK